MKPFIDEILCDVSPLEVYDVLLGKPYFWKWHVVYESKTCYVIITLVNKLYKIPKVAPPTAISLITAKQCSKIISQKIVALLQKYFYWLNLRKDVGKYIWSCTAYVITKQTIKKQGLYTPLPTPSQPWESISIDFMSGLPSTKHGNDCIFMVIDIFSKMVLMAAYKKSITAEATSKIFFEWVWVHFRIPQSIVLDRDSSFLGAFWSRL